MPFEDYVRKKVLTPMEMTNTFAENHRFEGGHGHRDTMSEEVSTALAHTNLTSFYSKNRLGFRKAIPVNNYYKLASGGYLSTSDDIVKFGHAYLDGKVLNEEILSPFLTSEMVNGNKTYYGLGWQVSEDKRGRPFYGHIGNGVGGYSNFFVYPEQEMVFAILINCTNPNVQEELDNIIDTLLSKKENNYLS